MGVCTGILPLSFKGQTTNHVISGPGNYKERNDSITENIFTTSGLGLCKHGFTGLTIKSNLQKRLKNPGV